MKAKAICGCYRRDEAHDPESFAAALSLVLGDYPQTIIEFVADPRTGIITQYPNGLPNVGQIKQFCDDVLSRRDRLNHLATLPKTRHVPRPIEKIPPGQSYFDLCKNGPPIGRFEGEFKRRCNEDGLKNGGKADV